MIERSNKRYVLFARKIRELSGKTLQEMSDLLGFAGDRAYQKWEREGKTLTAERINALRKLYMDTPKATPAKFLELLDECARIDK